MLVIVLSMFVTTIFPQLKKIAEIVSGIYFYSVVLYVYDIIWHISPCMKKSIQHNLQGSLDYKYSISNTECKVERITLKSLEIDCILYHSQKCLNVSLDYVGNFPETCFLL